GASARPNWLLDSSLGAQWAADINNRLTGTLQVVSKRAVNRDYTPRTEWAFLAYRLNNHVALRAGRIGTPYFLVSDYRNLNAANPWVRPPVDVYGQVPFSWEDGADVILRNSIGKSHLSAQIYSGKAKNLAWVGSPFTIKLKNLHGINLTWEYGVHTFRISHNESKVSVDDFNDLNQLMTLLQSPAVTQSCGDCPALTDHYAIRNDNILFQGIGWQADWPTGMLIAEVTRRQAPSILADTRAWYVTGLYRFGRIAPYVTVSRIAQTSPTQDQTLPAIDAPLINLLRSAIDAAVSDIGQRTHSVGVRWDINQNLDAKLQWDHVQTADRQVAGYAIIRNSEFSGRYNVVSASLDFTF
ncbi:MAG TPA: hypothetical protein VFM46_02435, partial [Pseudomonadales bacterium]|nr:hypothetical protein [Pseudomonadales bacterium]